MNRLINKEALSLEITTHCNLSCPHCFALANITALADMNWNIAQAAMKEGYTLGYRNLHITGGEPFLNKKLFALLDKACNLGYEKIIINTNATLLDTRNCSRLSEFQGRVDLTCSLNGNEKVHDQIRGKGSFLKALKGINKALQKGINVDIFTTVGKYNLEDIPSFVEYIMKSLSGIQGIFFIQLRRVENEYFSFADQLLSPKDVINFVRVVGFLSLYGYPVHFLENALFNVIAKKLELKWLPASQAIFRPDRLFILQDGRITANHSSRKTYGFYQPGSLQNIINSQMYQEDILANTTLCPDCQFYQLCQSCGMLQPSCAERNDLECASPFCQRVLRELH
ncbi:MAG: radical SAM protein [Spirochaetes bacterium]|nr:radical SAM protein [Spirochaetota bacterium]